MPRKSFLFILQIFLIQLILLNCKEEKEKEEIDKINKVDKIKKTECSKKELLSKGNLEDFTIVDNCLSENDKKILIESIELFKKQKEDILKIISFKRSFIPIIKYLNIDLSYLNELASEYTPGENQTEEQMEKEYEETLNLVLKGELHSDSVGSLEYRGEKRKLLVLDKIINFEVLIQVLKTNKFELLDDDFICIKQNIKNTENTLRIGFKLDKKKKIWQLIDILIFYDNY
ncbi:MAG TPA: hypothetical protein PK079_20865 [Leptospiraceae bacterium]|nr:hypothetical protein [Leptospiraceae bacterium]HMX34849.1 hypothetical protein [Leptospiraceae bacterium]HMY33797.1 hypothetical protein [Leptospiraceae bacterium]HMZ67181.1 hypothetical protein [Leptospiraceae bacterium]HNA09650.1 hypothetical protein [Leptospiraceae bacterium]